MTEIFKQDTVTEIFKQDTVMEISEQAYKKADIKIFMKPLNTLL